ncbi:hypothetical protein CMI37_26960 [Candidatus Pacearchaeota archaeon]|nr:hypothetical protein [Candidatus Pacearchaeota archaeon]|tara:strand:+ start:28132 stop:29754 length:1623 start_codon:yes stop_codon:yes gene_type:complete
MEETSHEVEIENRKQKIQGYLFGWMHDNYDKIFLIVLAVAFIIRFWIFLKTYQQPLWWDAADYLATAKRWGLGLGIRDLWYPRRGFLWPLISAVFFQLRLGETGIRFLEVLFSTGIVATSYFLIRDMFNKKLALLTSISLTASWIILFFTARPLTSIPATFFLFLSLLFFWKGYMLKQGNKFFYLFGIFFALAVLTRMQYLLFLLPFFILIFTKEKFRFLKNKKLWLAFLVFLIIISPQIINYTTHYGNPVTDILNYYFGIGGISQTGAVGGGERTLSATFSYFRNIPYILTGKDTSIIDSLFSPTLYLLPLFLIGAVAFFLNLFLCFDKIFKNQELQKKLFVLSWITTLFLVLGYITELVEQRYVIPALPFIFLLVVFPLPKIAAFLQKQKINKKITAIIVIGLLVALSIPNIIWANQLIETKKTSYLEVKQAGEWIKQNSDPNAIVISDSLPQIAYYSERSTYPFDLSKTGDPSKATREEFEQFIQDNRPKYLVLSSFERYADWANQYLQENQGTLKPVQAYPPAEQPILIIYEFQYS